MTMRTTKWTVHYHGALKTGLPMGCAQRMIGEGVPELMFEWLAKATRRIMAQKQQVPKTGFVVSLVPQCMGPTPQFDDVSAMCAGGPKVCPLGSCPPFPGSNLIPPSPRVHSHMYYTQVFQDSATALAPSARRCCKRAVIMSRSELCTPHTGAKDNQQEWK